MNNFPIGQYVVSSLFGYVGGLINEFLPQYRALSMRLRGNNFLSYVSFSVYYLDAYMNVGNAFND